MLVGQENSRASLEKTGGRREEGGLHLETRCCWAAENSVFRRNGNKDSTERQSWAAVHPIPGAVLYFTLGHQFCTLPRIVGGGAGPPGPVTLHRTACPRLCTQSHAYPQSAPLLSLGKQHTNGSFKTWLYLTRGGHLCLHACGQTLGNRPSCHSM